MNDFIKLKNSLVSVINLNEYDCASLKIPWGGFLTNAHLTIENNIGKNNSYRANCLLSTRKMV